jgi:hypothetical protein
LRSTWGVKGASEFAIASFDQAIDLDVAVVGRLPEIGGEAVNVGQGAVAEALKCHGPQIAKELPIRFGKVSRHDWLRLMSARTRCYDPLPYQPSMVL